MRTMNASALTTTIEPMTTKRMKVSLVSMGTEHAVPGHADSLKVLTLIKIAALRSALAPGL